jgi:hypothetical protein
MSNINKIMEAYLSMKQSVSEQVEEVAEAKECPKCEGKGCDHCDDKGVHEKKLDPVDDKENDKKFKDRKDKDIDNDGDVDSSDEYLHKRRAATDDAIDGGDKPADDGDDKKKGAKKPAGKTAEISKIEGTVKEGLYTIYGTTSGGTKKVIGRGRGDSSSEAISQFHQSNNGTFKRVYVSFSAVSDSYNPVGGLDLAETFEDFWAQLQEAANPKANALEGEKIDSKESPKSKEFIAKHKKSEKKYEDDEEDGHNKTFKAAGKDMKQAPARNGADNLSNGDKSPVKGK